jgi:hypothetical protein
MAFACSHLVPMMEKLSKRKGKRKRKRENPCIEISGHILLLSVDTANSKENGSWVVPHAL